MSYPEHVITFSGGATVTLSRSGDIVTMRAEAGASFPAGGMGKPLPSYLEPRGTTMTYRLPSPTGSWAVVVSEVASLSGFLGVLPIRLSLGPYPSFTHQWLAEPESDPVVLLDGLLSALPGFGLLTADMKDSALAGSRIPDDTGVWPDQPGYANTYDIYYAALVLLPFLQAQPTITNAGSEGTSITVSAPNWAELIKFYRSQSPIYQATDNDVLTLVPIPDVPHVKRVPMNDRGGYYGDIDTDVS